MAAVALSIAGAGRGAGIVSIRILRDGRMSRMGVIFIGVIHWCSEIHFRLDTPGAKLR